MAERDNYREVTRRAWEQLAGTPDDDIGSEAFETAREIVDPDGWIPWPAVETVLCLASGGGWQAPLIASLGLTVTVLDISGRQLERDRVTAARHGLDLECIEADMVDLSALAGRAFDLVYQPISTCYLPDLVPLYRAVASVTKPGALYWSEHWTGAQIQLADNPRWDGEAYRISQPIGDGQPILWRSAEPVDGEFVTCWHYAHSVGQLLGGLCEGGFGIERITEPATIDPDAVPGSSDHLSAYVRPFLRVLARRSDSLDQ